MATPKKGTRRAFTEQDKASLKTLAAQMNAICKMEGVPIGAMEAMARITPSTRRGITKGTLNYNVINIMRICNVLGYEIVLAKRAGARNIKDDPDAMLKIKAFKEKQLNAKRKERGLPEGRLPTKVRVRKDNLGDASLLIHSRRDILKSVQEGDDFLNA